MMMRMMLAVVTLGLVFVSSASAQEFVEEVETVEVEVPRPRVITREVRMEPAAATQPADDEDADDADTGSTDDGSDPAATAQGEADPEAAGPTPVVLHLMDGSVISGELGVDQIHVDTDYGRLTVPVEALMSFRPGLESHPELGERIEKLIEQLGAVQERDREQAKRELLAVGPLAMDALRKRLDDKDAERKLRVRQTLDELMELQDDAADDPSLKVARPLPPRDEVVTQRFTILGKIVEDEFELASKYGPLRVALADVREAKRPNVGGRDEILKKVDVRGGTFAPSTWEDTGIRLERGDRVTLKAEGRLTLSPWGSNTFTGPEGSTNHGKVPDGSPMGALVGKVGKDGEQFVVGSDKTFTVQKPGTLLLSIAMHPSYVNNQFPGGYEIKVRVVPGE